MEPHLTKTDARAGDRSKLSMRVLIASAVIAAVIAIAAVSYAAIF